MRWHDIGIVQGILITSWAKRYELEIYVRVRCSSVHEQKDVFSVPPITVVSTLVKPSRLARACTAELAI